MLKKYLESSQHLRITTTRVFLQKLKVGSHGLLNIVLDLAHSAHDNILYYVYWSDNENIPDILR